MRTLSFLLPLALLTCSYAAVYTVTVNIDETTGQQGLGFDPSAIHPNAGDTITFTFGLTPWVKNGTIQKHSATQSTFDNPCTPLAGGFDTGVQETHLNTGSSFDLLVNSTDSLWFYSSVGNDCNAGMVLAVNPLLTGQTAAAFQEKAKTAPIVTPSLTSASGTSSASGNSPADSSTSSTAAAGPASSTSSGGGPLLSGVVVNVIMSLVVGFFIPRL